MGVVQQPVEDRGGDNHIPKDFTPLLGEVSSFPTVRHRISDPTRVGACATAVVLLFCPSIVQGELLDGHFVPGSLRGA